MDAGAIMQNDTSIENLRVMTDTTREYGVYGGGTSLNTTAPCDLPASVRERADLKGMTGRPAPLVPAGICFPWEKKLKELPPLTGDTAMLRRVWEQIDSLGDTFIYQLLLSF